MPYTCNGTSSYLNVASTPVSAVPLTLACWFRTGTTGVQRGLVSIGDTAGDADEFLLSVSATETVQALTRRSSSASAESTTGLSVDTWHHGCAVFNSATDRRAFIDGGSKGTEATSKTPVGLDTISVGRRARLSSGAFFDGDIAHVAIWNATLLDGEVAALAKGFPVMRMRRNSLLAYFPLFGGSPSPDLTGGGYSLTLVDSPTVLTSQPPRIASPYAFASYLAGGATPPAGGGGSSHYRMLMGIG